MGPPPRLLDKATLDPALQRLIEVPGYGSAWRALTSNATLKEQRIAHFDDMRKIWNSEWRKQQGSIIRDLEQFVYRSYNSEFMLNAAKAARLNSAKGQWTISDLHYEREDTNPVRTLPALWRALSVPAREALFLEAWENLTDGDYALSMYRLFVPELPITVCAGDGQEIIDVFEAFLLPRPVKSYARDVVEADWRPVPNKLFDQAFGIGGEETIPRPRATRAFIGDMVVQRGQVFAQMIFAIMRALNGKPQQAPDKPSAWERSLILDGRDCQVQAWKSHKKVCGKGMADAPIPSVPIF